MAANAKFAIEVEFISNLTKEFGDILQTSKRSSGKIIAALEKLLKTQIKLKKAQATLADAFKVTQNAVGLSTAEINRNNVALLTAAGRVQLLNEQLRRAKAEYNGTAIAGRGFLAGLIAQKQNALDLSRRLDVAIKKIITYRIAFGVFREATEAFKDMFVQAIDMDDALGDLQKVLRGTSKDIERLRDAAFDFGIVFGRTPKDIVEGFKVFAQQGLDVNGILERTNALMLAVSATTLTTREAIRALTVASKNFGDEFTNLEIVVDKFLVAEREVPVAAKDFADALAVVGQPAKELGLTLDELNGIVAAIGEVTQKSGKAIGTSLKTIIARVVSKDSIKAFKDLKIAVLESAGEFRPLGDILRDLNEVWKDLNETEKFNIAIVLGQKRRFNDFLALMNNFNQFLNVTEKSQRAFNDAQLAANIELDKFRRRIESVNTAFIQLKEAVGRDLLESLINLDGGFSSTLQVIAANSDKISTLIKATAGIIVIFVSLRGLVFLVGGALRLLGVNYLTLVAGTAAAATATGRFAITLGAVRAILGPFALAISLVTTGYFLWKSATDKTAQSQNNFNDVLSEGARIIEENRIKLGQLKLGVEEFSKIDTANRINKDLLELSLNIDKVTKKIAESSKGTGKKSIFGTVSAGAGTFDFQSAQTEEDIKNVTKLTEELRLLNAQEKTFVALRNQALGVEILPEDLKADELEKVEIAIERIIKATNDLTQGNFKGVSLKNLDFDFEIADPEKALSDAEVQKFVAVLGDQVQRVLLKEKSRLFLPVEIDDTNLKKPLFFAIDLFNRLQLQVQETIFRINNFNTEIAETKRIAELLGKPFNEAAVTLKVFGSLLEEVTLRRRELLAKRSAFQAQLDQNLKTTIKIDDKEKNAGLVLADRKKLKGEIAKLDADIKTTTTELLSLENKLLVPIGEARNKLQQQLIIKLSLKKLLAEENAQFDKQKNALGLLSAAAQTQSQSGFKVAESLQRQLAIDKELIKLELARAEKAAEIAIADAASLSGDAKKNAILAALTALDVRRLAIKTKIAGVENKVTKALIQQAKALDQEIRSSISAGLTAIPTNIADRSKAENDIAIKRKELEFEIADFRKQLAITTTETERSRINQNILEAQRGLRELQQDAKELGNIFTDVFDSLGGIADIAFRKSTENLVDALLDVQIGGQGIGVAIASQIGGKMTEAGFEVAEELSTTAALSAVNTGSAITVAHQTGALEVNFKIIDGHIVGIDIGSKRIELAHKKGAAALQASLQIGAQILGQLIGGGGARAGIGAGIGSLLGSLLPIPGGALLGGAVGGVLGGLFDNKRDFIEPLSALKAATDRNSTAIENNNKLLELSRDFINAPARFVPPPVQGSFGGGINGGLTIQNVNINASTTAGGAAAARSFVAELDKSFNDSVRNNRSTAKTF